MTPQEARTALQAALDSDQELAARFAAATGEAEFQAIADEVGVDWAALSSPLHSETEISGELTDAELGSMSGGFLPRTDWFTCEGVKPPWLQ
jgi:hypothetical protein